MDLDELLNDSGGIKIPMASTVSAIRWVKFLSLRHLTYRYHTVILPEVYPKAYPKAPPKIYPEVLSNSIIGIHLLDLPRR